MTGERALPVVTVVVPMLNEKGFIESCLAGFAAQDYPLDLVDVVVVDGGSSDGSRRYVDELAAHESWVRVVENPKRRASAAFNAGVEAAKGSIVCLFSAHGVPDRAYVRRSVEVLVETGAAGVGGRYEHEGLDPISDAVGAAMVSPFGMASPHRFASTRATVDTISHPAYQREALDAVGPFDETLLRNSDYELNHRLCEMGAELVFDPSIASVYRPRGSLRALGRQFWWYGRWKERVIRRHPTSLKARHLAPPAAVVGLACGVTALPFRRGRQVVFGGVALYTLLVVAAVVHARPDRRKASIPTLAGAFPVMHVSWGAGFLASMIEDRFGGARGNR
jgi:succinoglycan biosynthesis protein ExoA